MNHKLITTASAAALLGVLAGYAMGKADSRSLEEVREARAQILRQSALDAEKRAQEAVAEVASVSAKLAKVEQARARDLDQRNADARKLAYMQAELRELQTVQQKRIEQGTANMQRALDGIWDGSPLSVEDLVTIAQSFHDIEHRVAAGEFPGLNRTNAYERLKALLDNPHMERLIADYDTVMRN